MILVAGLAIAGLAGIVAAFYFSLRPGSSRVRTTAGPNRGRLRENPGPLVADRGTHRDASAGPMRSTSNGTVAVAAPLPEAPAGRRADAEHYADASYRAGGGRSSATAASRSRRRGAWRKGADVDQEFWPIEAFGGVSDEQFWDDLAADKPPAPTVRAAQADSGSSRQPTKAYRPPRPGAADRTAVQPAVQSAVQSVQAATAPSPIATQPYPAGPQPSRAGTQPSRAGTQPSRAGTQPSRAGTQPVRAANQPAESRARPSAKVVGPRADEDPLTSPAYSLRAKGAVDGRSYQSSNRGDQADPLRSDGYRPGSSASAGTTGAPAYQPGSGSAGRHACTAAYPFPWQSHSRPIQSTSTPSYGDMYGYRNPVSPANPGRANGNWGYGGPSGNAVGVGHWSSYPVHPPVDGYRGPYDPWGVRARLTRLR